MKKVCTVMIGLPALGKSYRVKEHFNNDPEAFIHSTDTYIERCAGMNNMTYSEGFSEFIDPATKHMSEQLDIAIRSGQNVIWDQTNLGVKKRKNIVKRMSENGYLVFAEVLMPPAPGHFDGLKEWDCRLMSREGKIIPKDILSNMYNSFVVPTYNEGFDVIEFFDMYGNRMSNERVNDHSI